MPLASGTVHRFLQASSYVCRCPSGYSGTECGLHDDKWHDGVSMATKRDYLEAAVLTVGGQEMLYALGGYGLLKH